MSQRVFIPRRALCLALAAGALLPATADSQWRGPKPSTPPQDIRRVPLGQVVRVGPIELRIGAESEDGPYLLGGSVGLEMGGDGTIYASEYPDGTIKAFDPSGRHLVTFGRAGRGPGEFINPIAMMHDGDSTLYATQGEFGTTVLTAIGDRIEYRRTIGIGDNYRSLCLMGDTVVAAGWVDGHMIHVLDADGKRVRSFGEGWSKDTLESVRAMANRMFATVKCDDRRGRIYLANLGGPSLRAYTREGALLWERALPDFRHAFFFAQGSGTVVVSGEDFMEPPVVMQDGERLLVQTGRVDFKRAPPRRSPRAGSVPPVVSRLAYVLDARSGRILSRSRSEQSLGVVVHDTLSLTMSQDPFPEILRRTLTFPVPR